MAPQEKNASAPHSSLKITDVNARIALHALVLDAHKDTAAALANVFEHRFPGSVVKHATSIRQAQSLLHESAFDLVALSLDCLRKGHLELFAFLRAQTDLVPVILFMDQGVEAELATLPEPVPATWELVGQLDPPEAIIERRVLKTIESHQKHWELNHLQKAFQSSLVQYRHLFDQVPDLIFVCDRAGCLLDVNASVENMFSHSKEQLLLQPIFESFGISRRDFEHLIHSALNDEAPLKDFEIQYHRADGSIIIGLTHLIPVFSAPGRPQHFQGVIKDISPRKTMERKLRMSEERYKSLYEMAKVCSSSLKVEEVAARSLDLIRQCIPCDSIMLMLNRRLEELNLLAAWNLSSSMKLQFQRTRPPSLGQGVIGRWAMAPGIHVLEPEKFGQLQESLREWVGVKPGRCLMGCTLGRGNATLPPGVLLFTTPVEKEHELNEDLINGLCKTLEMGLTNCFHYSNSQDTEKRYRELWEHAPAMFVSMLKGGEIFEVNKMASQTLEYTLPELIGHAFSRLVADEDRALFDSRHHRLVQSGEPQDYELRLVKHDGERMTASFKAEPIYNSENIIIGAKAILNDITRQKELEARLRDYTENLQRMVQERTVKLTQTMNFLNGILEGSTEYAIIGLDEEGGILHFNHGAQLMFGYEAQDMVSQETLGFLIDFEHAPVSVLDDLLEEVNEREVLIKEVPMLTSEGRSIMALLTMNRLRPVSDHNLNYVAIIRDISAEKELEELLKLYTENLQQVIEQKTRELENQHIQLIQSSKLATLGEMATGIAHEMNQPLSGIRTRAQLVQKTIERVSVDPKRVISAQNEIIGLVDRISNIIKHIRVFARQDQQRFSPFNLAHSVEGALSLIGEQLRIHGIAVSMEAPEDLPMVLGESSQLEQVILNLLSNARDACDERAAVLKQDAAQDDESEPFQKRIDIVLQALPDDHVCLSVHDNGAGMDRQICTKIFEPFFTTKPVGQGTGLGLSISYGIITNHQGRIEIDTDPEEGSTFRIMLPMYREPSGDNADETKEDGETQPNE